VSSVRCENGMWEWDVGMVFVVFSHLGKVRANLSVLILIPTLVSKKQMRLVANQIGIAIVNWEMRFRSW